MGALSFWNLFCFTFLTILSHISSSYEGRRVIVVTGNFTIDGVRSNVAQYDIRSETWITKYSSQLFLYGEDNGVIWDIAVNSSETYEKLYTVGLFDTASKTSQVQLCSVAQYDGLNFEKVGEGLCSRGGDIGSIVINTIVIGNGGDLFVGGNFATRVWDGHHFVYVYHVAQFDAKASAWLPLSGGGELRCQNDSDNARVNSLAWDSESSVLYIGGRFHSVDDRKISSGLVTWSPYFGLESFPGLGVGQTMDEPLDAEVHALAFEPTTKSLFVAGTFLFVNGTYCPSVAFWSRITQRWRCLLNDQNYRFSEITAMTMDRNFLYIAGRTNAPSWDFNLFLNNYGIARLEIDGLIEEYRQLLLDKQKEKEKDRSNHNNNSNDENNGSNSSNHSSSTNASATDRSLVFLSNRSRRALASGLRGMAGVNHNSTSSERRLLRAKKSFSSTSDPISRHPTISPTFSPSILSTSISNWSPQWDWLPNFEGTNGPILKLVPGKHDLEGSLFIGGAFNNLPALIVWNAYPGRLGYGNITAVGGGRHSLEGLVTAVDEIFLPLDPTAEDDTKHIILPNYGQRDYTFVILLACVGLGVLLGLCFTISCYSRYPYADPPLTDDELAPVNETVTFGAISLKTLADGQQGNAVDFKECFERAMKFRHLPTYETLIIINPKEILLSKIIGEGSFGRVWSGQWRNNAVAVKEFVFAQAAIAGGSLQRNNIIEEIVGEAGVMACLRHPKILQLYGCSLTMQAIWIVSELCVRGSLKMILMDHGQDLPMIQRLSILTDVSDGMQYLHNRAPPIIHRDLKSHNIFITEPSPGHFVAKIGDWGSARAVALTGSKSMTQGVGTACWLSPEVINNAHFSKSSDVYAFGIILWEVYTRQEIYEGLSAAQIIAKVAHEGLRPQVPRNCPWAKVMTRCWKQDPSERPDFEDILNYLTKLHQRYQQRLQERQSTSPSSSHHPVANIPATIYETAESMSQSSSEELLKQISREDLLETASSSNPQLVTPERTRGTSRSTPRVSATTSPSKRGFGYYDSFHPSLENLRMVVHDEHSRSAKEPLVDVGYQFGHSTINSSRSIDSAAHLAPEIAQLEMQSLIQDESPGNYHPLKEGFLGTKDEDEADATDFLFSSPSRKSAKKSKFSR